MSQSIVSGTMPLIPAESRYALVGCSSGNTTDDIRYDSLAFGCHWPILPDALERDVALGMSMGIAAQKIDQSILNIGDLFEYELIASGNISKGFHLSGDYVVRPFCNGSLTIGYISNSDVFGGSGDQDAGAFPIDALDYYCGIGAGIAILTPMNWTVAADMALSRNFHGTFTDRSGKINHSLARFQILSPLKILESPINLNIGWTWGKRDDARQKEWFVGLSCDF